MRHPPPPSSFVLIFFPKGCLRFSAIFLCLRGKNKRKCSESADVLKTYRVSCFSALSLSEFFFFFTLPHPRQGGTHYGEELSRTHVSETTHKGGGQARVSSGMHKAQQCIPPSLIAPGWGGVGWDRESASARMNPLFLLCPPEFSHPALGGGGALWNLSPLICQISAFFFPRGWECGGGVARDKRR